VATLGLEPPITPGRIDPVSFVRVVNYLLIIDQKKLRSTQIN